MQPTYAVTRNDLSMTSTEFDLAMDREGFIGHRVLPFVLRTQPTGEYPKIKTEYLLADLDDERSPDGGYKRSTTKWDKDVYSTDEYGHEVPMDDRTIKKYNDIIDAEFYETSRVADGVLRRYEKRVADLLFNTTTFSGKTSALGTPWSTIASAVPLTDIDTKRETIVTNFGKEPNALIINRQVFRNLRKCDSIVDKLKAQNFQDVRPERIGPDQLAIALDLEQVIVAGAIKNTANVGLDKSLARIWSSSYALLACIAKTDDPAEPCLGRTIQWVEEGSMDGDRLGVITEEYREERTRGSVYRVRTDYELKTMYLAAGWLFSNVT